MIVRHVLDSLAGLTAIKRLSPRSILDVGSGGGFPGIMLALFLPEVGITLLDRSTKKTAFLANSVALLGLTNCRTVSGSLAEHTGCYDIVCCRAFRPLLNVFSDLLSKISPGGSLLLYKGRKRVILDEIESVTHYSENAAFEHEIIPVSVPFLDEERHLLIFRHQGG